MNIGNFEDHGINLSISHYLDHPYQYQPNLYMNLGDYNTENLGMNLSNPYSSTSYESGNLDMNLSNPNPYSSTSYESGNLGMNLSNPNPYSSTSYESGNLGMNLLSDPNLLTTENLGMNLSYPNLLTAENLGILINKDEEDEDEEDEDEEDEEDEEDVNMDPYYQVDEKDYNHKTVELKILDIVQELYEDNIIPKGTILYHGSLNPNLIEDLNDTKSLFFGLEPSIAIWYTLELYELADKEGDLFLYIFQLEDDLTFDYIKKFKNHPSRLKKCINNPCLHPQFVYHGDPLSDKYIIPSYNISIELTIPKIKTKIISNVVKILDTLSIDKNDLMSLRYRRNEESLNYIFHYSIPSYLNKKIMRLNIENDHMNDLEDHENIIESYEDENDEDENDEDENDEDENDEDDKREIFAFRRLKKDKKVKSKLRKIKKVTRKKSKKVKSKLRKIIRKSKRVTRKNKND
jgi:hypothetical protein